MAKVITLEGLRTAAPDSQYVKCSRKVPVHSAVLERDVEVCVEDLERAAKSANVTAPTQTAIKRRRGRPKGSTVKAGAKRPAVKACSTARWVSKGKRSFCQCQDKGNSQMLSNKACGRGKKGQKDG